jgi:heme-degrading monooxygenase HmoA
MHLAQVNVARALEPLDSPLLRDFVAALAPVNALADAAPGFVWRLQTEDGDATAVRVDPDPRVIVNLSVWESLEALWAFVYGSAHVGVMQRRRTWFERRVESHLAMWWVPAGTTPAVDEAMARLAQHGRQGSTARAFDFKHPFDPDGEPLDPAALRILPAACS